MSDGLIVQSDGTVLLDSEHEQSSELASELTTFARLEQSPGRWHHYELLDLSLWNAAASGSTADHVVSWLEEHSQTPVSRSLKQRIRQQMGRYGAVRLVPTGEPTRIKLAADEPEVIDLLREGQDGPFPPAQETGENHAIFLSAERGLVKQYLAREGWPVVDLVGYEEGQGLSIDLLDDVELRDYQQEAREAYHSGEAQDGGSGVILLPCGAGKTVVGMGLMSDLECNTLIIATHRTARRQWRQELQSKTTLEQDQISEYKGDDKEIRPVTLTTYNMLTYRDQETNKFLHMDLFKRAEWGLIIYDEVHLLPAPVFRATAEIQSRRRLGLTATLVREDGRESDVFSLIGPKRYECPWQRLSARGWISQARCKEVRVDLPRHLETRYNRAEPREQHNIASQNPRKLEALEELIRRHDDQQILIIGYYLDQLEDIYQRFDFPLITGETPLSERLKIYDQFRQGDISGLVLSKVGNYSVDLPNAGVLIQVSGTFGSRQEEAQRLGRVLRPNEDGRASHFYQLVTDDTVEADFARRRKLFLLRQGYQYEREDLNLQPETAV